MPLPNNIARGLPRTLATLAAAAFASLACAAGLWPDRPLRLITAFSGGISDTVAHTLGEALAAELGQPVVVESHTGAGGNIGVRVAASAGADGHTLLLGGGWLYTNHLRQPNAYNDPDRHLQGVAPVVSMPYVWLAHPSCGCASLAALAEQARRSSAPMPYGSPGVGTPPHLLTEQWGQETGSPLLHVPYRGGGALLSAAISGEVAFTLVTITSALPHIRQGSLVPLGVTSAERSPLLPAVPTVGEQGYPAQEVSTWFGLFAPAGLPAGIADRLAQGTGAVLRSAPLRNTLASLGAVPFTDAGRDEFAQLLRAERERWARLVTAAPAAPPNR